MRKQVLISLAGVVVVAAFGSGVAAQPSSPTSQAGSAKPLQGKLIWHLDGSSGNPAFTALAQGINKPLMAAGAKLVRSYSQNAAGQIDVAAMAQAFDRAIAAKPAAITYFVFDNKALGPQAKKARAAGIPVFAFSGKPVRAVPVNGYLELPNYAQGVVLAKTLAQSLPKGAEWTEIAAGPTPNTESMLNGAEVTMKAAGMKLVGNRKDQRNLTDVAAGAQQIMQALVQKYPNLRGVFAFNDDSALGVIAAIKAAGKTPGKDILVVSRNGAPDAIAAVRKGDLLATCDIGIPTLGITLGTAVRDHLVGKRPYNNTAKIQAPPAAKCIVSKKNISSYLPWEKQLKFVKIEER